MDGTFKWKRLQNYWNVKIFWNEEEGIWLDYDILNNSPRHKFYPSNITPLWANCWDSVSPQNITVIEKVLDYLNRSQATQWVLKPIHSIDLMNTK